MSLRKSTAGSMGRDVVWVWGQAPNKPCIDNFNWHTHFHSSRTNTRSHGSVRVVRTTSKVNGKCWTLTPKLPMNPLSDRHQIWYARLCREYLPSRKIWAQSVKGFLLPIYAKYTPKCSLRYACLLLFLVLPIAWSRDACMDLNANTTNDAVLRKDDPFDSYKSEFSYLTVFFWKIRKNTIVSMGKCWNCHNFGCI